MNNRIPRLFLLIVTAMGFVVAPAARPADLTGPAFSTEQAIAQRLMQTRAERAGLGPSADPARKQLLEQLEVALLQHREAVLYLAQVREEADSVRESLRTWKGFDSPGPYSIRLADSLHATRRSLAQQLQATQSRLRIIDRLSDELGDKLEEHQKTVRRFREETDLATSADTRRRADTSVIREEISLRIAAESLARLQLRRSAHEIQQAALESALELNGLKIEAVRGKIQFLPAELEAILQRVEQERTEVLTAVLENAGRSESRDRQVTWKLDIFDIEEAFWKALYNAFNAAEASQRASAVAFIRSLKMRLDDWVDLIRLEIREAAEEGVGALAGQATRQDVEWVIGLQSRLEYALEELGAEGLRGPTLLNRAKSALLAIWGAELYLAEETASVAGEKVTTYRAVTLGKLLRLAFILALGWFLLRFLSRRLHALLTRRPNVEPGMAETVRSWTFGLGLALLLLWGLNRVHIPFTAFAFLGGTLAIGIGFGAQTLLKNFISGVILSFERPFKVGDLVVVEDITGYIRRIGLRASVIEHFDGTDTLVPNSALLENRVTNWTYGNTAMRGSVDVGVAYGSQTRDVSRALLAVAAGHGLVLDDPEPTVRFESFGDNAMIFRLLFWFDASHTRPEPLASDLRFMIDKAFAEAGIVIAFPQRDIHFDEAKTLRVELSRASPLSEGKKVPG